MFTFVDHWREKNLYICIMLCVTLAIKIAMPRGDMRVLTAPLMNDTD